MTIFVCVKVLLDIKEDKADFVMELLRNLKFVKAQTLTPYKADVLEGVKESAQEAKYPSIKADFLNLIELLEQSPEWGRPLGNHDCAL